MVAKEWWEARWKFVLAAVVVLAVVVVAPRPYGVILSDTERDIERARAELASPEAFMGPEEMRPPGYTPEMQVEGLKEHIERMQQPDYPVGVAEGEVKGVGTGASFGLVPFAALLGVALVSGEVSRGSIFLLLSRPISRTRLLLTKYLLGVAALLAVALLGGVGIVVSGYAHGYPAASINAGRLLASAGLFWLGTLSVLGVSLLASVLFRDVIRSVIATAATLYAIFYLPDLLRGIASYWTAPSEPVSFEDQMVDQAWYQSFEALRIINYWLLPNFQEQSFPEYQPSIALCIVVCLIAAVLPLLAALWVFRRKSH